MDPTLPVFIVQHPYRTAGMLLFGVLAALTIIPMLRNRRWMPVFIGLILSIGLLWPSGLLSAGESTFDQTFLILDPARFVLFILPLSGLVAAAFLIYLGINSRKNEPEIHHWYSIVCTLLAAVLLVLIYLNLYWLVIWDSTVDSLGELWIVLPLIFAVSSGIGLVIKFQGWLKITGIIYLTAVPAGIIGVFMIASQVDFRVLTDQYAAQVTQAAEAYHEKTGSYPASLQDLPLWQRLTLPEPAILYGQGWCYQGGQDYYRIGYLDREHWSSPLLYGHVYAVKGHFHFTNDICQAQIEAYRDSHPYWLPSIKAYGKPTPTPDLRD